MKSYLSLIPISAKVRKRQNRMTVFCILIAVFLVTSVFSMADMGIRMEKQHAIDQHGNWHFMLHGIPEEAAAGIARQCGVAAAARYDAVNYKIDEEYYLGSNKLCICGADKAFVTEIFDYITQGRFPEKPGEILLTENAARIYGYSIGDIVTARTPTGNLEFTVCGFMAEGSSLRYDAVVALMPYDAFCEQFGCGDTAYYIQLRDGVNARQFIADVKEQYDCMEEQLSENTALLGITGYSSNAFMGGLYLVAFVLFLLVLFAGVLMIAGSINSSVAQRTQFFGMLRCIGASQKQILHLVRLETLQWCSTAVPIGVGLGIAVTWALCAVLRYAVAGEFLTIPLFAVSPIGIGFGAATGVLSVLLAARAPAKRAAKVSPMAAVRGIHENGGAAAHVVPAPVRRIDAALGVCHATGSKKTLILMTVSFALSILLFLSFSVLIGFVHHALTPLRPYAPDLSIMHNAQANAIDTALVEQIREVPGVKCVFGRSFMEKVAVQGQQSLTTVDIISYEQLQLDWAKQDVVAGDIRKLSQDGNYVMTVFDKDSSLSEPLAVGDRFWLNGSEVEVACILSDSPFDSDGTPTILCNEQTFARLFGAQGYAVIDIQATDAFTDRDVEAIRALAGDGVSLSDRRSSNREVTATYWAFSILVYGFLTIVAMITVFHIMNSISMSVSARIREYGAMRAVGMDKWQLARMIAIEALTYAFSGCLVGCAAGIPLHRFLFQKMISDYWGELWCLPIMPLMVVLVLVLFTALFAVMAPAKRICNMPITETINEL